MCDRQYTVNYKFTKEKKFHHGITYPQARQRFLILSLNVFYKMWYEKLNGHELSPFICFLADKQL